MILPGISLLDADYVVIFIRLIKSEIEKRLFDELLFSTKYTDIKDYNNSEDPDRLHC